MYLGIILIYVLLSVGICWLLAMRGNHGARRREGKKNGAGFRD